MTQYEMQVLQADIRMLSIDGHDPIEFFPGAGANGQAYAVLHTDSLAELSGCLKVA